jgi:hypothetical protein
MWSSYSLWREFVPQLGLEDSHCHKKRGYSRIISKEVPNIDSLNKQDTTPQKISKLAQRGIYYLYHNPQHLTQSGIDFVASKFLSLYQENEEVQDRVFQVLINYLDYPFLKNKKVIYLESEEDKPASTSVFANGIHYKLFFKFDCVVEENAETIHIIDFKTGKNDNSYDLRQAFIYLLASQYLYENKKAIASFYNLESKKQSEIYSATKDELEFVKIKLAKIAIKHQEQITLYRADPKLFENIFSGTPGKGCQYCQFNSICEDYLEYV